MVFAKFFNRRSELNALRKVLTPMRVGAPGRIVLLTGPKDSGKSALLREFCARQLACDYKGVPALVDMRMRSNMNPSEFATNLADSFAKSLQLKVDADPELFGGRWAFKVSPEKITLNSPWSSFEFSRKQKDSINMVMAALEGYMSDLPKHKSGFFNGFPTIFIDEANALASWTRTAEGAANLEALLRFLVRISEQQNGANVVLASSENFFKDWLCGKAPIRGHNVVPATVGHLTQEEAKEFVREAINDSEFNREGLEAEVFAIWDDVYAHYGGAILLLESFLQVVLDSQPGKVCEDWEVEKQKCIETAKSFVASGFQPDTLAKLDFGDGLEPPDWTDEDWKVVVKAMAGAEDGVVPFYQLSKVVSGPALISIIRYELLHYRVMTGWERDIKVRPGDWPVLMPVSRAQHLAMKQVVAATGRYF